MEYNFEKFPKYWEVIEKIKINQKDDETNGKSIKYLTVGIIKKEVVRAEAKR